MQTPKTFNTKTQLIKAYADAFNIPIQQARSLAVEFTRMGFIWWKIPNPQSPYLPCWGIAPKH